MRRTAYVLAALATLAASVAVSLSANTALAGQGQRSTAGAKIGIANFAAGVGQAELTGLQEGLIRRGFLKGQATGTMDAATTSAIRRYQAAAGLPVTGDADYGLLQHVTFVGASAGAPSSPSVGGSTPGASSPSRPKPRPDAFVRRAQELLKDQGLYSGKIDGLPGSKTAEAVSRFESLNGLRPTGKVTPDLLVRLGATQAPATQAPTSQGADPQPAGGPAPSSSAPVPSPAGSAPAGNPPADEAGQSGVTVGAPEPVPTYTPLMPR